MSQNHRLSQTQQQRLQQSLSPLQVKYYRMLEMNQAQAEEEVNRALEENPALEVAEPDDWSAPDSFNETAEEMQLADYANDDEIPPDRLRANNHSADDVRRMPEAVEPAPTLFDIIVEQARLLDISERELDTLIFVAGNLDDNGYLTRTVAEMSADMTMISGHDVSPDNIRAALKQLQTLDPAGIGATDLRQCLLLQLRRRPQNRVTRLATDIIAHNFDLFSHKHFDRLASATGTRPDSDDFRNAIELIRGLNPKPGSEVAAANPADRLNHISPDFMVETDEGESLTVSLLNAPPELRIEATFEADNPDGSANAFIRRQRDEARGFISVLNLRQQTLFRVMNAIAVYQRNFFLTGDEHKLRPMILKNISEATGYDTSVVSRATQGKYVLTPWGIFPLKFFFNERFNDSEETSSRAIMAAIRDIIGSEDHRHPLNDDRVVERLQAQGMNIARRTVAKYREQLGIPVARLRREL